MSDEELKDIGLTSNAVGQLRSIVKSQTTNGLNQISADKKLDGMSNITHPVMDSIEGEVRFIRRIYCNMWIYLVIRLINLSQSQ